MFAIPALDVIEHALGNALTLDAVGFGFLTEDVHATYVHFGDGIFRDGYDDVAGAYGQNLCANGSRKP